MEDTELFDSLYCFLSDSVKDHLQCTQTSLVTGLGPTRGDGGGNGGGNGGGDGANFNAHRGPIGPSLWPWRWLQGCGEWYPPTNLVYTPPPVPIHPLPTNIGHFVMIPYIGPQHLSIDHPSTDHIGMVPPENTLNFQDRHYIVTDMVRRHPGFALDYQNIEGIQHTWVKIKVNENNRRVRHLIELWHQYRKDCRERNRRNAGAIRTAHQIHRNAYAAQQAQRARDAGRSGTAGASGSRRISRSEKGKAKVGSKEQ